MKTFTIRWDGIGIEGRTNLEDPVGVHSLLTEEDTMNCICVGTGVYNGRSKSPKYSLKKFWRHLYERRKVIFKKKPVKEETKSTIVTESVDIVIY